MCLFVKLMYSVFIQSCSGKESKLITEISYILIFATSRFNHEVHVELKAVKRIFYRLIDDIGLLSYI